MAKLHHQTLKSAVAKYAILHAEGKSEQEVKAEIAKDDKVFDEDATAEIYAAIIAPADQNNSGDKPAYSVTQEFRDINNFAQAYKPGHDVGHFDKARLDDLVAKGLVIKH